jgi:hypothetical protein
MDEMIKYCPNLVNLDITVKDEEWNLLYDEPRLSAAGLIKNGLTKLAELVINDYLIGRLDSFD